MQSWSNTLLIVISRTTIYGEYFVIERCICSFLRLTVAGIETPGAALSGFTFLCREKMTVNTEEIKFTRIRFEFGVTLSRSHHHH